MRLTVLRGVWIEGGEGSLEIGYFELWRRSLLTTETTLMVSYERVGRECIQESISIN